MKTELLKKWEEIKEQQPRIRIRDVSVLLGVSEAELLASKLGNGVWGIKDEFPQFLKSTEELGYVMALTRNEACVHERKGIYKNVSVNGQTALAVGDDIDLRIFLRDWKYGFYVEENENSSFQFFSKSGDAIHKIYKTNSSNEEGWKRIKSEFITEETLIETPQIKENPIRTNESHDETQIQSFLSDWSQLKDTHDFFSLLKRYNISRVFAVATAENKFSFPISVEILIQILKEVASKEDEIMIFVGNPGMIQIHTGKIKNIQIMGPWFNILDPEFNLHLRMDLIHRIWIVDKPTSDGLVTSIEVFDRDGELIIQFFGKRKPGIPQKESWFHLTRNFIHQNESIK